MMAACAMVCIAALGAVAWRERAGGHMVGAQSAKGRVCRRARSRRARDAIAGVRAAGRRGWLRLRRGEGDIELGMVAAEVAARLRAGASPSRAWADALEQAGVCSVAAELDRAGVPPALRQLSFRGGQAHYALPAAIAVCRLSALSGAPMAQVLDSCADGITESAEAAAARAAALAEPITSAQMLALLPLAGIVLGFALGADPLAFLAGTWPGRATLAAACALEAAGVIWVRRLHHRANESGM